VEVLSSDNYASTAAVTLRGNSFNNIIYGNAGNNTLIGGGGADVLLGLGGDDSYYVDSADDQVVEAAGQGRDVIYTRGSWELEAGLSVEILSVDDYSGTAAVSLVGNELDNAIYGNAGNNLLIGGGGNDALVGGAGDDVYYVDASDEIYEYSGGGHDVVYTSTSYQLRDNSDLEILSVNDYGSRAAIDLSGNELNNLIYGNAGSNVIDGKGGNDTLIGMGGADAFAFTTALGSNNVDSIIGFDVADDTIRLAGGAGNAFASIEPGGWSASAFTIGNGPTTAEHRIIYHQPSGALYYDSDGAGAAASVLFALVTPGLNLTATNFTVTGGASAGAAAKSSGEASVADWDGVFASVQPSAFANSDEAAFQLQVEPVIGQQDLALQAFI
jgi:Ca2+-binding RTX toxin-like protein